MAYLSVTYQDQQLTFGPDQARMTIGRSTECDLLIPDEKVSRNPHLELTFDGERWIITDHSRGGTWEGVTRLTEPLPVADGRSLHLGSPQGPEVRVVQLREDPNAVPGAPPAPSAADPNATTAIPVPDAAAPPAATPPPAPPAAPPAAAPPTAAAPGAPPPPPPPPPAPAAAPGAPAAAAPVGAAPATDDDGTSGNRKQLMIIGVVVAIVAIAVILGLFVL